MKIVRPFGPTIALINLPENVLNGLRKVTNEILNNADRKSYGQKLAGVIKEEPVMVEDDFIKSGAKDFIEKSLNNYALEACREKGFLQEDVELNTFIRDAWLVSQNENEYNPIHNHAGSEISSVIYLNVPNMKGQRNIKSKIGKEDRDGDIEFIYSAGSRNRDIFENGNLIITPVNGLMIIFPSFLYHGVYPFIGAGERRSIALNASYRLFKSIGEGKKAFLSGNMGFMADKSLPYAPK